MFYSTEKGQSQPHYSDYFHAAVPSVFERLCCTLSAKHGNLCSHSGCLSETKRTGQLGKLETAASICTVMKTRWAGRAGRSRRWHSRWRKGSSAAASSGCYGENGGEMRGDRAAVSKVKGDRIILQQVASTPRPHIQVMNSAGLPVLTGRAIISHQPPSSAQQVKDLTLLIDLSGQQSCVTTDSLIIGWTIEVHRYYHRHRITIILEDQEKDTKWK